MNLNRAQIIGRVTGEILLKTTPSGQAVVSFGMATNRQWKDKNGEKQEAADFHNIVAWGRTAEVIAQWSGKGKLLFVEGRLQTREWEDKSNVKHRTTEIIVERVQLGPNPAGTGSKPAATASATPARASVAPARQSTAQGDLGGQSMPVVDWNGEDDIKPEDIPF